MSWLNRLKQITTIKMFCAKYMIEDYKINEDLSIDVNQTVQLGFYKKSETKLRKLPIKFNFINGDFFCGGNLLSNFEGAPVKVNGSFSYCNNNLSNLQGCPKQVLTFYCNSNEITSLKGVPQCSFYELRHNKLKSLIGIAKNCKIDCEYNNIRDIYGIVSIDEIWINHNPVFCLISKFINRMDKDQWIEFFNDCDIIRGEHIIWDRLVFFYDYLDLEIHNEWKNNIQTHYRIIE